MRADELKLQNRRTYQELIFEGMGYRFNGETYCLPRGIRGNLAGDVAIANNCGSVWPMKNWAYYDDLKQRLEERGLSVNYLPQRRSVLEHIGDIQSHKFLISGDTLPMHIALGSGVKCLSLFTCTSPWEIHDYGLQVKIVSPLLDEFFYKRTFDPRATTAISLDEVYEKAMRHLAP
jgi:heptosyltransferase-2